MRRVAAVLAVLALVLVGCETSQIDGSATVTVSGRILRADGSPAAGVPVGLEREPTVGEVVTGLVIVPLTLFTACLADPPPALCRGRSVRRTTTGADGAYAIQLSGNDTRTFFGNARTMSLTAELPPAGGEVAGAAVVASFRVQTENLVLKDLQMWEPKVTVAAGRISWQVRAGGGSYRVGVEDARSQPVWSFDSRGSEVTFDPRVLEDTSGTLAVSSSTSSTADGTTVDVTSRSARVGYRSSAGAPVSRGRPCTQSAGPSPATCPFTDGDFISKLPPPETTTTRATSTPPTGATGPPSTAPRLPETTTIDLGQARSVSLVVVRGCACQVEGSTDGQTWRSLGRASGFTAVDAARGSNVRLVRLTGSLSDLREVSVWDRAATAASSAASPVPTAGAPAADLAAPTPQHNEESRRLLIAVAALLVVALAAAATAASRARL